MKSGTKRTKSEVAYSKIVREDWRPTTRELFDYLGVGDAWGAKIKSRIKRLAALDGHVWGYHPRLECFVLAPKGNINDARDIIEYSAKLASYPVVGLEEQIKGAANGGLVTQDSAKKSVDNTNKLAKRLASVPKALVWAEA